MGYLKILCALLIWSSLGIFVRMIDLPNTGIVFYSSITAGTLQLILLYYRHKIKKPIKVDLQPKSLLILIMIPAAFVANSLLFYFAFRNTTIANAVLTHYTAPVFVALMAPILLKEHIHKSTWGAIILSSLGLWLILGSSVSENAGNISNKETLGIIAGAMSGVAYAFLIITIRKIASKYSSIIITCTQSFIVALLLTPFAVNLDVPAAAIPMLLTLGIVHSTIAPLLYVQGFKSVRAHEAAILGYFEPVGATILAIIFLHEIPGQTALAGGAMILLSGYIIMKNRQA
ncbi:MAG: EamA family transporter [Nitrospira sp.]|nr:EamA family transporter [bacterium]MBL7049469.1 EamA family transporter [Nitrospira sp.]